MKIKIRLVNIMSALLSSITIASAQQAVDVHSHNILPVYMDMLEKHDAALEEGVPVTCMGCRFASCIHGKGRY